MFIKNYKFGATLQIKSEDFEMCATNEKQNELKTDELETSSVCVLTISTNIALLSSV